MSKLTKKEIILSAKEEVHLSKRAEKRYAKIFEDMKAGKNVYEAKDINDFITQLERA